MAFGPIDLSEIFYLNHTLYMHTRSNKFLSSIHLYNIIQIVNLKQISFISKSYPHSLY